jgi:hypothetical protein
LGVDRGLIEMFGPFGFSQILNKQSRKVSSTQTGELYHAALAFIVGILFYFFITTFAVSFSGFFDPATIFLFVAAVPFLAKKSLKF